MVRFPEKMEKYYIITENFSNKGRSVSNDLPSFLYSFLYFYNLSAAKMHRIVAQIGVVVTVVARMCVVFV